LNLSEEVNLKIFPPHKWKGINRKIKIIMKKIYIYLGTFSLITLILASLFASSYPDGLEKVAEALQFAGSAQDSFFKVLCDYEIPGMTGFASSCIAGLVGIIFTFIFVWLLGKLLRGRYPPC